MCREHDPRQVPATSHNLTQPLASLALDTCLLEMHLKTRSIKQYLPKTAGSKVLQVNSRFRIGKKKEG